MGNLPHFGGEGRHRYEEGACVYCGRSEAETPLDLALSVFEDAKTGYLRLRNRCGADALVTKAAKEAYEQARQKVDEEIKKENHGR